jgi:hypothetical protein
MDNKERETPQPKLVLQTQFWRHTLIDFKALPNILFFRASQAQLSLAWESSRRSGVRQVSHLPAVSIRPLARRAREQESKRAGRLGEGEREVRSKPFERTRKAEAK